MLINHLSILPTKSITMYINIPVHYNLLIFNLIYNTLLESIMKDKFEKYNDVRSPLVGG